MAQPQTFFNVSTIIILLILKMASTNSPFFTLCVCVACIVASGGQLQFRYNLLQVSVSSEPPWVGGFFEQSDAAL